MNDFGQGTLIATRTLANELTVSDGSVSSFFQELITIPYMWMYHVSEHDYIY